MLVHPVLVVMAVLSSIGGESMNHDFYHEITHTVDVISASIAFASFFDLLPHIASLLSVIWFAMRIYAEATDRGWIPGRKRRTRKEDMEEDDEPT